MYAQTGHELDRKQIEIAEPIKTTGMHSVPARLHDDVTVFLQVVVSGPDGRPSSTSGSGRQMPKFGHLSPDPSP